MTRTAKDREVIRDLAARVAEIAALPVQQETIRLHKALNALEGERPMVMIDQVCWNEMDVDGELALKTETEVCRAVETELRRTLYQWKHMRADMVVEPVFDVQKPIRNDFGIKRIEDTVATDPANDVVGHHYVDQIRTEEDIEKIQFPRVRVDEEASSGLESRIRELLDGILTVRMKGRVTMFPAWDQIVQWRGAEDTLLDLAMRPDFMHKIMSRLTEASLAMLDQLEEKGLLAWGQGTVHCTGAYTDELPKPGFDPARPRAKDLWTCGMAQIFASVSPAMHKEFELDYAVRWYERFGLVYYGCCEPLDCKLDIVRAIPHLRKVSMSPWVNVERGAEGIGRDFVFSRKPSPALLAVETWDLAAAERHLRETLDACKRHNCPLEFILKDISTVRYEPQRLWQWADMAMRVVRG